MTPFTPTHLTPAAGMATWPSPDGTVPAAGSLPARLPVEVVEELGAWTRIRCSNGWEAWVDGRLLDTPGGRVAPGPAGAAAPGATPPLSVGGVVVSAPLVGAAATAVAVFLPWVSGGLTSGNGLDVPVKFLLDHKTTETGGLSAGLVLLLLAVAAGALMVRPALAPPVARRAVGGVIAAVAALFVVQMQRVVSQLDAGSFFEFVGLGAYAAIGAGLLIALGPSAAVEHTPGKQQQEASA